MLRPSTIMDRLTSAIAQLDPTPWQIQDQGEWHEARTPFAPGADGDANEHLAYIVLVERSRPVIYESGPTGLVDEYEDLVSVIFRFGLDPLAQMQSVRLSADAAGQIAALVERHEEWAHDGIADVSTQETYEPLLDLEGRFIEIRLRFLIRYDRSIR